jgi:hypothetical protein
MKPGNKDWQGKGCMVLMLIGEIVTAIFIIFMLIRRLPVVYIWLSREK